MSLQITTRGCAAPFGSPGFNEAAACRRRSQAYGDAPVQGVTSFNEAAACRRRSPVRWARSPRACPRFNEAAACRRRSHRLRGSNEADHGAASMRLRRVAADHSGNSTPILSINFCFNEAAACRRRSPWVRQHAHGFTVASMRLRRVAADHVVGVARHLQNRQVLQ